MWKRSHLDLILRQDLLSLEMIRDIDSLEMLISLLSYQVGSLENLFLIFKVPPFSTKFPRSVKKACKYYFYDIAKVRGKDAMQEVDFLILKDHSPCKLFEVKLGAQEISPSLRAIGNHCFHI